MVMGSPPESYDPEQASSLLKSRGNEVIDTATKNLLSRGILSKSQRDPLKQKPGRQLKISEVYVSLSRLANAFFLTHLTATKMPLVAIYLVTHSRMLSRFWKKSMSTMPVGMSGR